MTLKVKICGLRGPDAAIAAARAGADLLGFVFFSKSPRAIAVEAAGEVVTEIKRIADGEGFGVPDFVGLFVDAGEKALAEAAPFLTHFQLHGHEDAERVAAIRAEFGLEVIKAVGVAPGAEIAVPADLAAAADVILLDARPPKGAVRPGGHGATFDWSRLRSYRHETPFMVAGGLTPENVAAAIAAAGGMPAFAGVDVSSGVESKPGLKDAALIARFVAAARAAG
jgi:phosphoribosylanthranilate isomerase